MSPESLRRSARGRLMQGTTLLLVALLGHARAAYAHHLDARPATHGAAAGPAAGAGAATPVEVRLSEWRVSLSPAEVPPGRVRFHVTNAGKVPHAFEIEGHGLERRTPEIQPGADASLEATVTLAAAGRGGSRRAAASNAYTVYKVYCPVGKGSHRMLGMQSQLQVEAPGADKDGDKDADKAGDKDGDKDATAGAHADVDEHGAMPGMAGMAGMAGGAGGGDGDAPTKPRAMRVAGGGTVVQILPGPYPFADKAQAIIAARPPDQRADLTKKAHDGPYSNHVAAITGDIDVFALDRGAEGDSVSGHAEFTTQDGARWRLDLDRVQTKDIPFNPRFGGVIMGLFYHGASGVHTPLVPTIQSSLALWAFGHLTRDGQPVADDAMVHIMLLSRTRRPGDWALDCWDCSSRPVEELQLQITPSPGKAPFDAPGGFLFVNWEKSRGQDVTLALQQGGR